MYCIKCGVQNDDNSNFCYVCGYKFDININSQKENEIKTKRKLNTREKVSWGILIFFALLMIAGLYFGSVNKKIEGYLYAESLENQNIQCELYDGHSINYFIKSYKDVTIAEGSPYDPYYEGNIILGFDEYIDVNMGLGTLHNIRVIEKYNCFAKLKSLELRYFDDAIGDDKKYYERNTYFEYNILPEITPNDIRYNLGIDNITYVDVTGISNDYTEIYYYVEWKENDSLYYSHAEAKFNNGQWELISKNDIDLSKITGEGTWVDFHSLATVNSANELSYDEYNSVIGIKSDLSDYAVY